MRSTSNADLAMIGVSPAVYGAALVGWLLIVLLILQCHLRMLHRTRIEVRTNHAICLAEHNSVAGHVATPAASPRAVAPAEVVAPLEPPPLQERCGVMLAALEVGPFALPTSTCASVDAPLMPRSSYFAQPASYFGLHSTISRPLLWQHVVPSLGIKIVAGGLGNVCAFYCEHLPVDGVMVFPMLSGPDYSGFSLAEYTLLVRSQTIEVYTYRAPGSNLRYVALKHERFLGRTKENIYPDAREPQAFMSFMSLWNRALVCLLRRLHAQGEVQVSHVIERTPRSSPGLDTSLVVSPPTSHSRFRAGLSCA